MLKLGLELNNGIQGVDGRLEEAYSPNNLYTEASAVNADDAEQTLGSWTRDGTGTTYQSVVESTGGTASPYAMRIFRPGGSIYEHIILKPIDILPGGVWTIGQAYKIRLKYKYVAGSRLDFEVRGGNPRVTVATVSGATEFSTFEYTWTASNVDDQIWFTSNWGITGVDEGFEFTDFEILLNS